MLKLTFYNLSVELQTDDYVLIAHIKSFLLKHYTQRQQKGFSQNAAPEDKVFGGNIKNKPIFMFHANQFIHLFHYLEELHYKLVPTEKIDKREYNIIPGDFTVRSQWELRDYQIPVVEFLLDNPIKSKLVPIQTGKGKAQKLTSRIKIPGGWSLMRDMKVGSIITAWDGTPTKVIGVFPQGKEKIYKITFSDGRTTECSGNHLWKVYYVNTEKHKRWRVIDTLEVQRLISMPNPRVYIPLCLHEDCEDIELPINPYILGVLLGDGHLGNRGLTLTNPDSEIINKVKSLLPDSMEIKYRDRYNYGIIGKENNFNFLIRKAKEVGIYNKIHYEKLIPDIYLYSTSYRQKLDLIQGLMDTDGYAGKSGEASYTTVSYLLAKQLQYLIRSIGGIASISLKNKTFSYKGETKIGRQAYQVNIRHSKPSELFSLPRKKERMNDNNQYAKDLKLRVTSVEYIGEEETQCISVEHPDHLYITDDFIVTHNTFTALYTIGQINHRLGIVILPTYIEKWVSDIATIHDAKQTDVMVVQGSKALAAVIEMAKTDSLENNYYIFSSRTMQEYINQYEEDPQLCIDMYGCAPIELFPLLGIGVMLVDETHQHYHAIFKILIYTNVKFQIGLSATLMSDDNLVARMHKVVYPNKCVYSGGELDRYTDVYAVSYTIPETYIRHIKTKNYGSNNYSHTAFEQSIIRNNDLLKRYIRMIKANVDDYYIDDYQDRDKIIVFVSTVALATRLSDAFRSFYPEFKIRRYCEEDSYEDMLGGDIIVSTPISAGTALDIPRLRVAINTVSISSAPTNIQILGRLRKLADRDVKYVYIYAQNINKQREYHFKRMELFKPRVANIALRQSSAGL